ncbi:unnamed protein product [Ectocarpus sp. CCAP 1310/34]|nr:unnamed protein product [Ectocarpus sp. CCAP 1310/34]
MRSLSWDNITRDFGTGNTAGKGTTSTLESHSLGSCSDVYELCFESCSVGKGLFKKKNKPAEGSCHVVCAVAQEGCQSCSKKHYKGSMITTLQGMVRVVSTVAYWMCYLLAVIACCFGTIAWLVVGLFYWEPTMPLFSWAESWLPPAILVGSAGGPEKVYIALMETVVADEESRHQRDWCARPNTRGRTTRITKSDNAQITSNDNRGDIVNDGGNNIDHNGDNDNKNLSDDNDNADNDTSDNDDNDTDIGNDNDNDNDTTGNDDTSSNKEENINTDHEDNNNDQEDNITDQENNNTDQEDNNNDNNKEDDNDGNNSATSTATTATNDGASEDNGE